jgi:hypothetical protein
LLEKTLPLAAEFEEAGVSDRVGGAHRYAASARQPNWEGKQMFRIATLACFIFCAALPTGAADSKFDISPVDACKLIFFYAHGGDRLTFDANSAMPAITAKCNRATTHKLGLRESDCTATQFLLRMESRSVPELTCKG